MLLPLQGGTWPAIEEHFIAEELSSVSPRQSHTVEQLASTFRSAGTSLSVIPTSVPGSAPGELVARKVLSEDPADGGTRMESSGQATIMPSAPAAAIARADEASVPRSLQYRADSDCAVRTSGSGRSCGGSEGSNK